MTRKRVHHPDPSVREPRFAQLSRPEQLALATWAVLTKAADDTDPRCGLPGFYARAVGDIAATVGLRSRKQMNHPATVTRRRGHRRPLKVVS